MNCEFKPCVRFTAVSAEPAPKPVSLSLKVKQTFLFLIFKVVYDSPSAH